MRSQKCMWVNNALQLWKGHSVSSTEINIMGVWKAMLRARWEPDRDRLRARLQPGAPSSHHLSGTPWGHFCIPFATDLLALLSGPIPQPSNWKQTTLMSEGLPNDFLPEQSQNIKHVLKKLHRSLEKIFNLVTAACAAPWLGQPWVSAKQWGHAIISLLIQWWQNSLCFYFQTALLEQ